MIPVSRTRLRRQLRIGAQRQSLGVPAVSILPAPHGGLNARDALEAMKPSDAIELVNFIPGHGSVRVRPGMVEAVELIGETAAVETLATWRGTAGGERMAAAAGGGLWIIAPNDTSVATPNASGFSNDRWQTANMNDRLLMVNGEDTPRQFTGLNFDDMTIQAAMGEPALDVTTLVGVNVYKSRAYYWTGLDQDFWYTAVLAHAGDLTLFPLGDVGTFGGVMQQMITWTVDGGAGVNDYAVFVMSSGEVIVYQGSNPGDAGDWSLVGVFRIGEPVGKRCAIKLGGDVLLITRDGYSLLSKLLPGVRGARGMNLSDRIGPLARELIGAQKDSFGWQPIHLPGQELILINAPGTGGFTQHVGNLATGAWTTFEGWQARAWTLFGGEPYFGGDAGKVYRAFTGLQDDGADVVAFARQAYSALGRGRHRHVVAVEPTLTSKSDVTLQIGVSTDYDPGITRTVTATIGVESVGGFKWGAAKWGEGKWGSRAQTVQAWIGHGVRGRSFSPSLRVAQNAESEIAWSGTKLLHKEAGVL